MNKSYAGGEIEKRAKEMLSALRAGCPDKVWHDLNVEMEEVHEASGAQWKNNLYTPKALVIVLVIVSAASFFLWRFLSNNSDKQTTAVTKPAPAPTPAPKPTPPPTPPVKKDTVVVKKDTPVKNAPTPVVNTPAPTPTPTVQTKPAANTANNDQLAQQRAAYYKRRDSIRAVRKRAKDSAAAAMSMNPRVGFPDTTGHHSSGSPKSDSAK